MRLIASSDGADGSVKIHADAKMFAGLVDGGDRVDGEALDRCLRGPDEGRDPTGVDREDGEVAVRVDAGGPALDDPPVGEGHLGRAIAQVVGVGGDEAVAHDDPAPPAPVAADADDRGRHGLRDPAGDGLLVVGAHGCLQSLSLAICK